MSDEKDYRIDFNKTVIYLPCNDNYKIIAKAVRNVCSLFDAGLSVEDEICKESKKLIDRKKGDVLLICAKSELAEMVKFHDSYWIEPKNLELKHILDPEKAQEFKVKAESVYSQLMSRISHR